MIDFFEAQERARRRTALLIVLFAAAIIGIVAVVYFAAHLGLRGGQPGLDPGLLLQVALGVGLVVGVGSAFRTAGLRSGGPAVAELLGGRRLQPDTTDLEERRFLNVVEEMAIASGTPVPAVYVLDREDGINAFAAGYSLDDAAVAATRGALRNLTRDELQGVVAHEFSHILNGDMRLNVRLIGLLYGILLLAVIGRGLLHVSPRGGGRRDRNGGGIAFLALALLLVGYIGVFFGKLIKAAVSRQREYLADSAAVEFTRNPEGLAGALKKIAGAERGSRIQDAHAEELSHLFFANGLGQSLSSLLSTHPPIEERIRRLDPVWSGADGGERSAGTMAEPVTTPAAAQVAGFARTAAPTLPEASSPSTLSEPLPSGSMSSSAAVARIGAPDACDLEHARSLLGQVSEPLLDAAHSKTGAVALTLALALKADDPESLGAEWRAIGQYGGEELVHRVRALIPEVDRQGAKARLPLLDLTLPALHQLSPDERIAYLRAVEEVVRADGRLHLFEYTMLRTLSRRLSEPLQGRLHKSNVRSFAGLRGEGALLLSALAWTGSDWQEETARRALSAGYTRLPPDAGEPELAPLANISLEAIDRALKVLENTSLELRKELLEACVRVANHDGRISTAEMELVRAIAEALDCPMPITAR